MSASTRSLYTLTLALAAAKLASAQVTGTFPPVPLASKHFTWPDVPYMVDTDQGLVRGTQTGYNQCNSTTENQDSLCQTSWFNDITDFCLWAPSKPGETVADVEGEMIAWCSKPGHGTRLIPAGALTGLQFLKTPDYIQLVGFLDQTQIDMAQGDFGGEMDPHGADLRGNPMGGIMFSTAFGNGVEQVIEWTNFMGSNAFCLKACDPKGPNAANYCQHIYDRIGCAYNAPNAAQDKVFEACDAENADFPGVYTTNGQVVTYTQPPESLGPITSIPYTARVPSSSNCTPFTSASIFTGLPSASAAPGASTTASGSGAAATSGGSSGSGSGSQPAKTGSASGANASQTGKPSGSGAISQMMGVSLVGMMGVVFSVVFLS